MGQNEKLKTSVRQCLKPSQFVVRLAWYLSLAILPSAAASISYQNDSTDFNNPERGFWGRTLVKNYVDIYNYRNTALPQSFLDKMQNSFDSTRIAGKKMVLRFKYGNGGLGDPSVQQMHEHIEQLRPLLVKNYDVIAVFEAGFVGAYGEWNRSSFVKTAETRREVLFKILDAVPRERMVAMRYNYHKREIFNSNEPFAAAEAFNGSNRSRTSHHNDCFLSGEDNAGTYSAKYGQWGLGVEVEKSFLSAENQYLSQGGESCEIGDLSFATCEKALADLKRMKWDMLNHVYFPGKLQQWKTQGCYEEISKHLGYRIRLLDATFDDEVKDGILHASIHLKNEGFGKFYNPRKVEMVLRNTVSGVEHILPLAVDPRFWGPGSEQTLTINLPIPKSVPFGNYTLFLNLPDPTPSLYGKPQYSVRLANKDVWDETKGYNSLGHRVKVSSFNPTLLLGKNLKFANNQIKVRRELANNTIGSVAIDLIIASPGDVDINVFDLSGKHIIQLAAGNRSVGSYSLLWKGTEQGGRFVSEGTYFIVAKIAGVTKTIPTFFQK